MPETTEPEKKSPWNSLEAMKMVVSFITPLTIAIMGFWIQKSVQSSVAKQNFGYSMQQHLAERRLKIYEEIGGPLNRIYCFIEDVGSWKEETPESIIRYKRKIDEWMYSNRAVWESETISAYEAYMDSAFKTFQGTARDALIQTDSRQKKALPSWTPAWNDKLTGQKDIYHRSKYEALVHYLLRDMSLKRGV